MMETTLRPHPFVTWLLRLVAIGFCFLSLWIVLPGPTYPFLVLAVGAPEISPLLLIGSILGVVSVAVRAQAAPADRPSLVLFVIAGIVASTPLIRFPGTSRQFDAAMDRALGADFLCRAPLDVRARLRPSPFRLVESLQGLATSQPVSVIQKITFGLTPAGPLTLDIHRPAASGTHPVVIQIYGGAWQRGAPHDDAAFSAALASAGYVVFAIDYRHAPRWRFPAELDDVDTAMAWIRRNASRYGGDSAEVAVIGRSSGAELALLATFRTDSNPPRAVVSYYGPVDLAEGYRHPPVPDPLQIRAIQIAYLGGDPDQAPDQYRAASPISYVRRGLPPALLIYGGRDHVVEPRFGRELRDSLAAAGDTAILLEIPWAEHAFDAVPGGPGSQLALYHVERFLAWAFGYRSGSC